MNRAAKRASDWGLPGVHGRRVFKDLRREISQKRLMRLSQKRAGSLNAGRGSLGKSFDSSPIFDFDKLERERRWG